MSEISYMGNELELFQHATIWKKYYSGLLLPYIHANVLEVGAGIGSTTGFLCSGKQQKWVCLEPDPNLFKELNHKINSHQLPACCSAIKGIGADLPPDEKFDTILYIDVIEHIEDDAKELYDAEQRLTAGGHLIVLVPAHQFLYNAFDKAIGHYRRYNKKMLTAAAPPHLRIRKLQYLDSLGLTASLVNKYFLKQQYPTLKQLYFWDKVIVRLSRFTDVVSYYNVGKTLVGVWKKPG